jgi:hypothetical protein
MTSDQAASSPRVKKVTSIRTRNAMNISVNLGPLAALIAGILILAVPRLLNYIVALYLIIIGILGLVGPVSQHLRL